MASMKKKTQAAKSPKTHFEQIPVEKVLEKLPELDAPKKPDSTTNNVILEPASSKTEPYSVRPRAAEPFIHIDRYDRSII